MKYYTGIGSRRTPVKLFNTITRIADKLNSLGYKLRTGDASGADAFFSGSSRYISPSKMVEADIYSVATLKGLSPEVLTKTTNLVNTHHPNAGGMSKYSFQLHQRNALQVLGNDLDSPSKFIICWATGVQLDQNGIITDVDGGTGQAVRIAYAYKIPCFNLEYQPHLERIIKWL